MTIEKHRSDTYGLKFAIHLKLSEMCRICTCLRADCRHTWKAMSIDHLRIETLFNHITFNVLLSKILMKLLITVREKMVIKPAKSVTWLIYALFKRVNMDRNCLFEKN